jgi:hypothetical protein
MTIGERVTCEAGWGGKSNQDVKRLGKDTPATVISLKGYVGGQVIVKFDDDPRHWSFPERGIKAAARDVSPITDSTKTERIKDGISYGEHNPTGKCRECGGPNYGKYAVCQACMRKQPASKAHDRSRLHAALDAVLDSARARDAGKPTAEQMTALKKWASEHGHTWRSDLHDAWMTGNYDGFEQANLLQQLRNSFGPTWLSRVKIFA